MNKKLVAGIAAAVLIAGGGIGITAAAASNAPSIERAYAVVDIEKQATVVEPVAVETPQPPAEPAPVVEQPAPAPAPAAPAGPARCPAGSTANSSDGVNDTSCFPNVCFTIPVPDPAYPECDVAFRP